MKLRIPAAALCGILMTAAAALGQGQKKAPASPKADAAVTIDGNQIAIAYSAPSVKGRKIFGEGGRISQDRTYPVWRAGANSATAFHTDADLDIGGLAVPRGDYTLFVNLKDTDNWELVVNKQTGQWGLAYDASHDLGRVKMKMSKPPAPIETLKYTLTADGGKKGALRLEWENYIASVPLTVK